MSYGKQISAPQESGPTQLRVASYELGALASCVDRASQWLGVNLAEILCGPLPGRVTDLDR